MSEGAVMFSEIHKFFSNVIEEIDTKGKADLDAVLKTVAADIRTGFKAQEPAIINQIATGSAGQDAATIAKDVLSLAESVIQQILVAKGL
jgi:hypothetical protein